MHEEILTREQKKLLPLVGEFNDKFGLVGGTAIALHLGHRRSVDFDLFAREKFGNQSLLNKIKEFGGGTQIIVNRIGELTLLVSGVKLTFFHFPYDVDYSDRLGYRVSMPDLLTLAAMKAFALGQRAKWKDYVDLYFIIRDHFSIDEISNTAKKLFDGYNEKLVRGQLAYFEGISYSEQVDFMPGFHVSDEEVKKALTEFAIGD